jgi:predicted Zn-dependent protease
LLEKNRANKEAQSGFLEAAAASSEPLEPRYRALLQEVVASVATQPSDDPLYLGRLAQAWRRLNEPAKAVALLERAVAIDPSSRPLRLQLAEALYSIGRYNDAEVNFQLVLGKARNGSR